jgi:prolyl-tRNA editing enzyme YbaK/EbsC (Cys-tRNA(Pro) deacylase)
MDSSDLARFIAENDIEAEIVHLPQETLTVAAAADALNVRPEQIIKSVLFLADERPILVVANGLTRINYKALADELEISRRRVKMAGAEQVLAITGYNVGAVPPFGHPVKLPVLIDGGVLAETAVYGGGGVSNALMYLSTMELQRVLQGKVVQIADR